MLELKPKKISKYWEIFSGTLLKWQNLILKIRLRFLLSLTVCGTDFNIINLISSRSPLNCHIQTLSKGVDNGYYEHQNLHLPKDTLGEFNHHKLPTTFYGFSTVNYNQGTLALKFFVICGKWFTHLHWQYGVITLAAWCK